MDICKKSCDRIDWRSGSIVMDAWARTCRKERGTGSGRGRGGCGREAGEVAVRIEEEDKDDDEDEGRNAVEEVGKMCVVLW